MIPTLFRIFFAQAMAYRVALLIWILSASAPLVMAAVWSTAAEGGPIGRFSQNSFIAYFLAVFVVRQITGCWVAWDIDEDVREGKLVPKLLKPMSPLAGYAAEHLVLIPLRMVVALPIAVVGLVWTQGEVGRSAGIWFCALVSLMGAWLISFAVQVLIGCLSFWLQSSEKIMSVWLTIYFVLSGYTIPVELLPSWIRPINDWLPFRFQLGLPVESLTASRVTERLLALLVHQWVLVAVLWAAVLVMWNRGTRKFAAFGG